MTLARSPAPAAQPAPGFAPPGGASAGGYIVANVPGPSVQTSPAGAGQPPVQPAPFGPTATPVIQRIDTTAPPPAPTRSSQKHSDDELDDLARALFGRIRTRLRNEYIDEREAKGLTFDHA